MGLTGIHLSLSVCSEQQINLSLVVVSIKSHASWSLCSVLVLYYSQCLGPNYWILLILLQIERIHFTINIDVRLDMFSDL